jgi:hypothetical protein
VTLLQINTWPGLDPEEGRGRKCLLYALRVRMGDLMRGENDAIKPRTAMCERGIMPHEYGQLQSICLPYLQLFVHS